MRRRLLFITTSSAVLTALAQVAAVAEVMNM